MIQAAQPEDWPAIVALLQQSGLPTVGLRDHLSTTLVARVDGRVVGCAALEMYGTHALLRSVTVARAHRRQGLGQSLTQAALDLARQQRITSVYLLTETADHFFPRFGFAPIERENVAPVVQQSVEFTTACPASAIAMLTTFHQRS